MISINSAQDRTILFDLLPLRSAGFRGFDLRLQILAVPGQAMYATTRRLVLKNVDSLVFVANSAVDRWEENLQSFREMTQNLLAHRLDPSTMPLVFQYNKRDLPQVMDIEFMDRAMNARKVDSIPRWRCVVRGCSKPSPPSSCARSRTWPSATRSSKPRAASPRGSGRSRPCSACSAPQRSARRPKR